MQASTLICQKKERGKKKKKLQQISSVFVTP